MNASQIPVTWRDLVTNHAEPTQRRLEKLTLESAGYAALSGPRLRTAMASCDGVLGGGIALCGPMAVREFVRGYHPHLARVVDELRAQNRLAAPIVHWVLNFALMGESLNVTRPPGFDVSLLEPLMAGRSEFNATRCRALAFTALALGDTAAALEFVDEKPARHDAPVTRVEFNQLELIRYLAAAIDARRPALWIEPVWVEYFELFPMHLSAEAAEWPDLFNFARVLANVRGDDVATLADDVHARVKQAAGS